MRYQNPALRGELSAQYALGTLQGRARSRFETLLRGDAGLREEVSFWHERFSEFAARLKPVAPREVVWTALAQTIAVDANKVVALTARSAASAATQQPARILVWQAWATAASVAVLALGLGLARELSRTETLKLSLQNEHNRSEALGADLQRQQARAQQLGAALTLAINQPLPYVAVIQPAGGDARWAITLHPESKVMRIALTGSKMPADVSLNSLELWMLDSKGKPHSLGLLPTESSSTYDMTLPSLPASEMGASLTLAVSVEPHGGSPTGAPTGKVLGAVPAVRAI